MAKLTSAAGGVACGSLLGVRALWRPMATSCFSLGLVRVAGSNALCRGRLGLPRRVAASTIRVRAPLRLGGPVDTFRCTAAGGGPGFFGRCGARVCPARRCGGFLTGMPGAQAHPSGPKEPSAFIRHRRPLWGAGWGWAAAVTALRRAGANGAWAGLLACVLAVCLPRMRLAAQLCGGRCGAAATRGGAVDHESRVLSDVVTPLSSRPPYCFDVVIFSLEPLPRAAAACPRQPWGNGAVLACRASNQLV